VGLREFPNPKEKAKVSCTDARCEYILRISGLQPATP
jgi:hypothetical protein